MNWFILPLPGTLSHSTHVHTRTLFFSHNPSHGFVLCLDLSSRSSSTCVIATTTFFVMCVILDPWSFSWTCSFFFLPPSSSFVVVFTTVVVFRRVASFSLCLRHRLFRALCYSALPICRLITTHCISTSPLCLQHSCLHQPCFLGSALPFWSHHRLHFNLFFFFWLCVFFLCQHLELCIQLSAICFWSAPPCLPALCLHQLLLSWICRPFWSHHRLQFNLCHCFTTLLWADFRAFVFSCLFWAQSVFLLDLPFLITPPFAFQPLLFIWLCVFSSLANTLTLCIQLSSKRISLFGLLPLDLPLSHHRLHFNLFFFGFVFFFFSHQHLDLVFSSALPPFAFQHFVPAVDANSTVWLSLFSFSFSCATLRVFPSVFLSRHHRHRRLFIVIRLCSLLFRSTRQDFFFHFSLHARVWCGVLCSFMAQKLPWWGVCFPRFTTTWYGKTFFLPFPAFIAGCAQQCFVCFFRISFRALLGVLSLTGHNSSVVRDRFSSYSLLDNVLFVCVFCFASTHNNTTGFFGLWACARFRLCYLHGKHFLFWKR